MAREEVRKCGKAVRKIRKAAKWIFVVFCCYLVSLFFRDEHLPVGLCNAVLSHYVPSGLVLRCDGVSIGLHGGLRVTGLRLFEKAKMSSGVVLAGADEIEVHPLQRRVRVVGARYPRLPDSYYAPGNTERNARVEAEFPLIPKFGLTLVRPDILSARPEHVEMSVEVTSHRIVFGDIRLEWPDRRVDGLVGTCSVDLDTQLVAGYVAGHSTQAYIRPLLVALDVPVSLPYMDGFTDVPEQVPARCEWRVSLVNNMFDLWLDLHPVLGKYNGVVMSKADGRIHLNSMTQGTCLNYLTEVGPISAVSPNGNTLDGSVVISGTNNYNVVRVDAKSNLSVAEILKIGGFTGHYVDDGVIGDTIGRLEFRFPRAMTNNYEVLNGKGHVEVKNGQLMRLKLFAGLTKLLAEHVPGIGFLVDQTEDSGDYVIDNGVIKTDNIYIEGGVFSIKMYGKFDARKDDLDFTVRVQFTKKDSLMGKYFIHPVTWPFTKLLLEFRLTGTSSEPQWEYLSVIDRVMDIIK